MSSVNVTISGVLCDKLGRTIMPCTLVGEATITGLGVGGGPIVPPDGGDKPPGKPPGIWGGPIDPYPGHPLPEPPTLPIPPDVTVPPPGSPPMIISGTTPTHPMVPPPAIVVDYPGIGKVVVPQPTESTPGK